MKSHTNVVKSALRAFESGMTANLASAVGAQALRMLVPLATYPYLARVFGVEAFGYFAFAQASGQILISFIEFGFSNMGGRELAEAHEDRRNASAVASAIIVSRLLLALAVLSIAAMAYPALHHRGFESTAIIGATLFVGLAYGFTPSWFYLGTERAGRLAMLELTAQVAGLILIFSFVHSPDDIWRSLLCSAGPVFAVAVWGHVQAIREFGWLPPEPRTVIRALQTSSGFFLLIGAPSMLNRVAILILGLITVPEQVAYVVAGDRILTVGLAAFQPFVRVFMPRVVKLIPQDACGAARLFRRASLGVACLFLVGSIIGAATSPWVTPWFFGRAFSPGWPTIALMILIAPPVVAARMIGFCGLVPLHHERAFNRIVLAAALVSLVLAAPAALVLASRGLALVRIVTEAGVAIGVAMTMIVVSPGWLLPSSSKDHTGR